MTRIEGPKLTPNALKVLEARYLRKDEAGNPVETPKQMFARVARAVGSVGARFGESQEALEAFESRILQMMLAGTFMPNSPTLMNAGRDGGFLSACCVLPVQDSIEGIFTAVGGAVLAQKAGAGTGFSFSHLRPSGDRVMSSGGTSSGPVSFMKVFSAATKAIRQGSFRRGANMGVMRVDHPDIILFINAKQDPTELTNFNVSVALTDDFMAQVRTTPKQPHTVVNPRNGEKSMLRREDGRMWTVGEVFDLICRRAWETGEPGAMFVDRFNAANPTPHVGMIEALNPCGEQPLLAYETCNLGSLNLVKFISLAGNTTTFEFGRLRDSISPAVRFLDNVIDLNAYPVPEMEQMSKNNRKIGLGVMGLADTLYALGIPYDSDEGVSFGEEVMKALNDAAHDASRQLAEERGVFPNWEGSTWSEAGVRMRNAATTTVAPTGTTSILAGCSSGIEPSFSLVYERRVLDGERLLEVNPVFESVAKARGFYGEELLNRIAAEGTIQDIPEIPEDIRRVFVTALDIAPHWHVQMQAAFQRHCDASISKTVNLPSDASPETVCDVFRRAYEVGCKGITVYRDGCRENQPLSLPSDQRGRPGCNEVATPMRLPEIMPAVRVRQATPFGNMHVKIVLDVDAKREREVFAQLGKGGDIANSDLEAICRLASLFLRVNGSLEEALGQLQGIGSTLTIPSRGGPITSLADGLAKAIQKYLEAKRQAGIEALLLGKSGIALPQENQRHLGDQRKETMPEQYKVKCPECGGKLVFEEGCAKCRCGYSQC